MALLELVGELAQTLLPPGDQDQVVAAVGELAGELLADAGRSAGDERESGACGAQPLASPDVSGQSAWKRGVQSSTSGAWSSLAEPSWDR